MELGLCPVQDAWGYLIVCVPFVVIFAPLGSLISSHFHRQASLPNLVCKYIQVLDVPLEASPPRISQQVLAALIYVLDTVALVTAFAVISMTTSRLVKTELQSIYFINRL